MKKTVCAMLCLLTVLCLLAGCGPKTAQTKEGFIKFMQDEGFSTEDITEGLETEGRVTAAVIADNGKYKMYFYKLKDEATAESVYGTTAENYDERHSTKSMSLTKSGSNYNYYGFNSDGKFYMVARVADTVLMCEADKSYRDEIVELTEKLGYK